ncbi:MAG: molecular chaperone DnaJ [Myxococcaceae bacterium]|nr:molecular chaperone DnaJ [Myxococcaceae bacterium]
MPSSAPLPMPVQVALVPTGTPAGNPRLHQAEHHLKEVLAELDALDAEVEAYTRELERFAQEYEVSLGDAQAEADHWERCLGRLRMLQDELARLSRLYESGAPPSRDRRRRAPRLLQPRAAAAALPWGDAEDDSTGDTEAPEDGEEDGEDASTEEVALTRSGPQEEARVVKRLHRMLARVLHPDLARTDAERARMGGLMAQANQAYEAGDLAMLELMTVRLGAGEVLEAITDEERIAHLEGRTRMLATAASSLRLHRERLRATATARLYEEARACEAEGRDYLAEELEALEDEVRAMSPDVRARILQLERAARALTHARSRAISALNPTDKGKKLRVFDPVLESSLVRKGVLRLERQRATERARTLARELEERAQEAPWDVWLTLMAFFAEAAGRPPPGLASGEAWEERYEALRLACPEAPPYEMALTRLPRHLELGLRVQKGEVRFGLQLREVELLAAVPLALQREEVAQLGRLVLGVLGSREACRHCDADVYLVHLMRTRGLDELHGQVCPQCHAAVKSYWLYSKSEGQEALLPHALRLGLVVEVVVRFGGLGVGFQLLPEEREALTAAELRRRLVELYVTPYALELPPEHLVLVQGGAVLPPDVAVGPGVVTLQLAPEAEQKEKDVLALLRSRIERRFRPDARP